MSNDAAPVLRVLNGRLAGTEKTLPSDRAISIGHQFWQDVVIREPATKGIALELSLDPAGTAQVTVLSGEASLLGSTVSAGNTALLPAYVPFSIGGVAMAWGQPESARWTEAGGLALAVPTPRPADPSLQDQAMAIVGKLGDKAGDMLTGWRLVALGGAGVLLVAATAAGPAMDALGLRADRAQRVERALDEAGLPQLRAANNDATGGVIVTGVVGGDAERAKAEQVLRASYIPGQLDVQTTTDLANASADVARIHGLQAMARPIGHAAIELRTTPLAPDQKTKLVQAVKTDVRQVRQVVLRDDLMPDDNSPVRSVADATKKVSTVVSGDPAYIQTADGARYFAGAMMPSGHRLVRIQGHDVLLEKNGRETRLTF
ncbi:hypothetical protein [Sphingomonas crocodyli]|uniref:YscD/Y4YQ C-terminal domain-containing protein n=1 Tax=Sphingomonas crocodyli TaxID=1979270 RepID=A0A437M702_9SPHN|nr:hypothetical protein [Sphingomonas crocodyli]RVT93284.1 hypothetical protein EOD43_05195 [Sphingomonas crocodyli]